MIRYADERDFDILSKYDKHIELPELKNSINAKRVLIMLNDNDFIGWLRFNLFWEKEMLSNKYKIVMTSTQSDEQAQFFYRKNGYIDCGSLLFPNAPLEIILLKSLA